jgi:hypothetical protein
MLAVSLSLRLPLEIKSKPLITTPDHYMPPLSMEIIRVDGHTSSGA